MASSQQTEPESNRFAALIQPIKDLAANWDIDIADSLNDYLEELEHLKISTDGGATQLNFAEAALLIQGSTAIYSKKVEYLYQLVLKSLEFITQKKNNKTQNANDASNPTNKSVNKSSIEDDILLFGNDPSFLLLDHLIEEGTNIDLKTETYRHEEVSQIFETSEHNINFNDRSFLSNHSASRMSVSMMFNHSTRNDSATGLKLLVRNFFHDD
jgi:hypothetical protein